MPPTTQDDVDENPGSVDATATEPPVVEIPESGIRREPGGARRAGKRRRGHHRRLPKHPAARRAAVVVLLLACVPALFFVFSVVGALRTPGNYSFKAKWADWLREHHAEYVVRELENVYFKTKQVKKGGTVTKLHSLPGLDDQASATTRAPTATLPPHIDKPKAVSLVVAPPAPGEGEWQPTGPLVHGLPGMYVSQFRADDVYTSQITSAVWIDPKLLRVRLVPGAQEPGGEWPMPHDIEGAGLPKIAAAFNGGFRFQDARGGFYLNGREAVPLVDGAASIVIHDDGKVEIGAWGREVKMSPSVEGVLQNLTLMVDGGKLDERINHNDTAFWGSTLGGNIAVARSGVGITADGALIYVAGPSLTAKSLAESLQRAGAVRAMTLDINPEWVTFLFYSHPDTSNPSVVKGAKLYPEIQRSEDRYLSSESRDFFTISTP